MKPKVIFNYSTISLAILSTLTPALTTAQAQEIKEEGIERIVVTGTRRSGTVQDAPLNITALDGDVLDKQNISELTDVARWVPGLTISDQGGRSGSPIIVRGLNTNSSGPESDGGTVAVYFSEIPMNIDLDLIDVERVEVLIGPQGTLYGAGTLGGAIRYIPKKVDLEFISGEIFGSTFNNAESDKFGGDGGFVFNLPIKEDLLGVRASVKYKSDPGFMDQKFLLRNPGTSLADPDWSNPAAVNDNLRSEKDINGEDTLTARIALRWTPNDWLDTTLTYLYQKRDTEGRPQGHYNALADVNPLNALVGKYDSAFRYTEPFENKNSLLSLEVKADLGFAELVSASGYSESKGVGRRDNTDIIIRLDLGYEEFPAFSIFTREEDEAESFTQELRLVSKGESDLSWIAGAYYNKSEDSGLSYEFAPGFANFAGINRADDLEYFSNGFGEQKESAIFGEISYAFTDNLDITFGARWYEFDVSSSSAVALPFENPEFDQAAPGVIPADEFKTVSAKDNGNLFKFNASYQFSADFMAYFTASEGFRIGGANGTAACPTPLPQGQTVCALPNERLFQPDTTTNIELGFKSAWLNNHFYFNAAVYSVDWDDPQVDGITVNGASGILTNAKGAETSGIEISTRAILSDEISFYATYATANPKLTDDAPGLFTDVGGIKGDRLPGSPKQQASLGVNYNTEVFGQYALDLDYGFTYQSDIITQVGNRNNGEKLPGFALSNLTATLSYEEWSVSLFANNLFNKYAFTSSRRNLADIGQSTVPEKGNTNGFEKLRNYGHYIQTPRTIGVEFKYIFDI